MAFFCGMGDCLINCKMFAFFFGLIGTIWFFFGGGVVWHIEKFLGLGFVWLIETFWLFWRVGICLVN